MAYQFDINNAKPTRDLPYAGDQGFIDLYNQIIGASPMWTAQGTTDKLSGFADQFSQMFKNATGRDPSNDELNKMFQTIGPEVTQSASGWGHTDYAGMQNLLNPYIQNAYGSDITNHQEQSQTDQLKKSSGLVQDLVNKTMGNTASQFSDPNSNLYRSFAGSMNNLGLTPSSGAFQAGAGETIANAGLNAANEGLTSVGLPQISNIAGTANAPYQMSLGNMYPGLSNYGQRNNDLADFQLQADLAKQLNQGGGASTFQQIMAGLNTGSNVAQGASSFKKPTWICTAMRKSGAMTEDEVRNLHDHLFRAFWKMPFKFLGYILFGKLLVYRAERCGTDWRVWKPQFYEVVMRESDPVKAVALYEEAFWNLYQVVHARDCRVAA